MSKLEIQKMLVLSTSHLSESTAQELETEKEDDPPFCNIDWAPSFTRDDGWMFYVPEVAADDDRYSSAPAELRALIDLGREQGVQWLLFDSDGDTVDNLPTFEW